MRVCLIVIKPLYLEFIMRINLDRSIKHPAGFIETKTWFAIKPVRIGSEIRFLEKVTVERRVILVPNKILGYDVKAWQNQSFLPNPKETMYKAPKSWKSGATRLPKAKFINGEVQMHE